MTHDHLIQAVRQQFVQAEDTQAHRLGESVELEQRSGVFTEEGFCTGVSGVFEPGAGQGLGDVWAGELEGCTSYRVGAFTSPEEFER